MFEAGLKTPATTAGQEVRDRCGRSSLLLSESCSESITVRDSKLVHRRDPFPGRAAPVGGGVLQRQPDQLRRRIVAREMTSSLDDLAQPRIDALDRVGRVNHAPDSWRKGKEQNDPIPGSTPDRRDRRIPLAPGAVLELLERLQSGLWAGDGVDRPQRLGEHLAVLPARVFEAVADQVHDARLQGRGRKCRSQVSSAIIQRACRPQLFGAVRDSSIIATGGWPCGMILSCAWELPSYSP